MKLRRTANAGFLLQLDGVTMALDGVSLVVPPYQATPPAERGLILAAPPDLLAYTHEHADHLDPAFATVLHQKFGTPIVGSTTVAAALPDCRVQLAPLQYKNVTVTPFSTRHIGKSCLTTAHVSFIIEGGDCVWFAGDAAPRQLLAADQFPRPDVLIAPFAYVTTESALQTVVALAPKLLVISHMPLRNMDPARLWPAVEANIPCLPMPVWIPEISDERSI